MTQEQRRIMRYIEAQQAEFRRLGRKAKAAPSAEVLHRLRVATRKLRTALWVLERSSPPLRFKGLKKHLRKLSGPLGVARELDVAIADAAAYRMDAGALRRRRKKQCRALGKKLSARRRRLIHRDLKRVGRSLRRQDAFTVAPALKAMERGLRPWAKGEAKSAGDFHRLRVAVKKARYALEATGRPAARLSALQAVMGRAHDLAVLQELRGKKPAVQRDEVSLQAKARRIAPSTLRDALKRLEAP